MGELGPEMVKKYRASNAALAAVDPKSGEVLAMVGSIDYNNSEGGKNNFAAALKQPGSSFKPFIYATAFGPNKTTHPGSITYDVQTDFGGGYKPNNYNGQFIGPITNRDALARSLNVPAVKNFYLAGTKDSIETAKNLGITTLTRDPNDYGLSLVLGSGEVRPVEMAAAYAGFANGGMSYPLRPILKIMKGNEVVKDYTTEQPKKVLEPETAWQVTSILSDNAARTPTFGARSNLVLPDRPAGVKTGTTQNSKDGWQVGYTPQLSVAVWVGNDLPGKTMTKGGEAAAGPIWNRFMKEAMAGKPVEDFKRPESMQQVTIDKLSGKLPTDQSPEDQRVTEWLAPWQVPKENDDVHVKVKIDKVSGKLASNLTPAEYVEEKTFFSVKSEVPDNPNWENPVQAWAQANGGGTKPPTDTDDTHVEGNRPTLTITSPVEGATVSEPFTIQAAVGGNYPITKVEFSLNGTSLGLRSSGPWSLDVLPGTLSPGSNVITVYATNEVGMTRSQQITVIAASSVTTNPDGAALGPFTNLVLKNDGQKPLIGQSTPIRIGWTNPSSPTLAKVNVYISTNDTPGAQGTLVKQVAVAPGSNTIAEIDVASLTFTSTYWFTLRGIDTSNAEGAPSTKIGPAYVRP